MVLTGQPSRYTTVKGCITNMYRWDLPAKMTSSVHLLCGLSSRDPHTCYTLDYMEGTKIGFIGAGNMAQAVVKGLLSSGINIGTLTMLLPTCYSCRKRI